MKKINQLLQQWPAGTVVTQAWLTANGLPAREAARYAERGGLCRVGHGAYARPGDKLAWAGGVYGLQLGAAGHTASKTPALSFWPGGVTALAQAGYQHYVPMGQDTLQLYGQPNARLARWFCDHDWQVDLEVHRVALFNTLRAASFVQQTPTGRDFAVWLSTPERAVLEWLHVTPNEQIFNDQILHTFEGLVNLRPRRMQALLEACRSVRVKRVLLLLAREARHAWYKRLNVMRIDLGTGKRQVLRGGRLDQQFGITVPEAMTRGD